jgi:hypothetical protein
MVILHALKIFRARMKKTLDSVFGAKVQGAPSIATHVLRTRNWHGFPQHQIPTVYGNYPYRLTEGRRFPAVPVPTSCG